MFNKDKEIIRELAKQYAEIAALPKQEQTRKLWRSLNGMKPERPMVLIDQVCWNEMNVSDELTLRCQDKELREHELFLRKQLYQWKHFPVDMVAEDFIAVPKAVSGIRFDIEVDAKVLSVDATNDVRSYSFNNQFNSMDDLHKIKTPTVVHDKAETKRRVALAEELYGGIINIREEGVNMYIPVWEWICNWMGMENALYAMIDKEEMMIGMVERMVAGNMSIIDQLEEQGLLCVPQSLIHCSGAWTDELPKDGYNPDKPRTIDLWSRSQAQMFSAVSPEMHYELDLEYSKPMYERFGLMYYGCCEPLDNKVEGLRRLIPNLRKISMSPWVNKERGAREIAGDFVYSCKPNPAFLAHDSFDEDIVRKDLEETISVCKRYNCPVEFILKDISTVKYDPQRLWRWSEIAMEVVTHANC